jgi:soluble lytic murein transglycosylase-like protein
MANMNIVSFDMKFSLENATLTSVAFVPSLGKSASIQDLIYYWSGVFGVDPLLILAQMGAESAYEPIALSHKGALGLMQVMPKTAVEMWGKYGRRFVELGIVPPGFKFNLSMMRNPKYITINVGLGVAYMKEQLDTFGSVEVALAAYNAGPGRIRQFGNKVPPPSFSEGETYNYVKKIMANYRKLKGF